MICAGGRGETPTAGGIRSSPRARGGTRDGYGNRMEEIDRQIVTLLASDGRMSFTELARRSGLSVSAAHQRVRRLEKRGVIRGYVALIEPADLGLPLTAFVSIKPFDAAAPDDAPQRLAHLASIEACHSVAGEESYILKVRVPSPAPPSSSCGGGPAAVMG